MVLYLNEAMEKWLSHVLGQEQIIPNPNMEILTEAVELDRNGKKAISTFGDKEFFAAVCFVDLSGFSEYCANHNPKEIANFANEFFKPIIQLIELHHGIVDKTIGDELMAFFPNFGDDLFLSDFNFPADDGAFRSLLFVKDVLSLSDSPNVKIGISMGPVILAQIGNSKYKEHTLYGNAVNLAKRLISENTPSECSTFLRVGFPLCDYKEIEAKKYVESVSGILKGCWGIIPENIRKFEFKGVGHSIYLTVVH